jgi:hypothetical protein
MSNVDFPLTRIVNTSQDEEDAAMMQLGPLTRRALGECELPWSAVKLLEYIRTRGNPMAPWIDAREAKTLREGDRQTLANLQRAKA